ncbi:hypothetical protein [Exiguobacterium aurantiacum]|uniref:hypothetical protein n=1 Tax=Exiguobacterium aurantiacum TaxID=33987 RepID=UPI00087788DA|nr:hypothetical protein [Exiguobacterium aurantiacum]
MDFLGLLLWIGLFINPFLGYQTGEKWIGRLTLGSLLVLMGLFLYRHSGFDAYESLQSVWDVLLTVYLLMLVMNSYLVSRRLVPELTVFHISFIALSSFMLSQIWSVLSFKTWKTSQLVDTQTLLLTLIIALILLLIVCLKMVDRRANA